MDAKKRTEERKKAIEAKRKKLEEFRKSKAAGTTSASTTSATTVSAPKVSQPKELDSLIDELLSKDAGKPQENYETQNRMEPEADASAKAVIENEEERSIPASTTTRARPELKLVTDLGEINLVVKETVTYDKGTQTESLNDDESGLSSPSSPQIRKTASTASVTRVEEDIREDTLEDPEEEEPENPQQVDKPLDEDEKKCIETDESFQLFLSQSTRVVERAMKQNGMFDVTIDYGGVDQAQASTADKLALIETILDERWTKDRTVSEIQWSPHHPELFLTALTKRQASSNLDWSRGSNDPSGVVLVWSTHMARERPEYIFTSQSPVHTAKFHPFASNLIVGGTYSGQIVLWDMRAKSTPVQRSQLSVESHTHPVYAMEIVGTANAHSLTSVSTDGRLCLWSLANISQPTESRQLRWSKKEISATAIAFPDGETNELFVGSEDGSIFKAQVHGSKAGVQSQREAHFGPITHMDFHRGSSSLSDLMLSCSMDWTVKLWSQRLANVPLAVFESSEDYVFDAQWSPVHPALFASVNGTGRLEVWNLNVDLEEPQVSVQVASSCALSCVKWAPGGRKIFAGDSRGRIYVYELTADVAIPRRDEWGRLENTISDLMFSVM